MLSKEAPLPSLFGTEAVPLHPGHYAARSNVQDGPAEFPIGLRSVIPDESLAIVEV